MSEQKKTHEDYIYEGPYSRSNYAAYVDAAEEILTPFPSTQIPTLPRLNKLIGGLRPKEFSILCGATGVGKTTFCANLSRSLIESEVNHFVASVETGNTDFVKRVMSVMAKEDLNTGDAFPIEKVKKFHTEHAHKFQRNNLWVSLYENRFSVKKLMNDIAYMHKEHGCKVAIVDNLNFFLEVTRTSDQIIEMDRVVHDLIIFCKTIPVHVIMVMHPKKTDHGRVESEFDIKGSSTAVQEAHNVFLFNRPSKQTIEEGHATAQDRELKIVKMRRKGRAVGYSLVLKSWDGVSYEEGAVL